MKKILVLLLGLPLLFGCTAQREEPYTELCMECGEYVQQLIQTDDAGICASCFQQENWQVCRGCQVAYQPDLFSADGYCIGCSESLTWWCSVCEEGYGLDHLADLGNGYFLCAKCAGQYLLSADPSIAGYIQELSPYRSRLES